MRYEKEGWMDLLHVTINCYRDLDDAFSAIADLVISNMRKEIAEATASECSEIYELVMSTPWRNSEDRMEAVAAIAKAIRERGVSRHGTLITSVQREAEESGASPLRIV